MKLASELSKVATGRTLYILDEPTTGLHFADVQRLLEMLDRLVDAGNTVVVIEHNLDVIKTADRIIDLGPEGGEEGGLLVAQGTPEQVAAAEGSYTGGFLEGIVEPAASAGRGARGARRRPDLALGEHSVGPALGTCGHEAAQGAAAPGHRPVRTVGQRSGCARPERPTARPPAAAAARGRRHAPAECGRPSASIAWALASRSAGWKRGEQALALVALYLDGPQRSPAVPGEEHAHREPAEPAVPVV